jgi:protein-S-isoprenylcysteine O-methyltransferase Ste14
VTRFVERGGLWVAAQGPLMLAAIALPPWLDSLAGGAWRWIAGAMLLGGMTLGIWSRRSLGASFTPLPKPLEGGQQATHGPYRFVRHPMYLAIIVSAAGWAELWQSIAGALAAVALFVFFDLKAAREERWLEEAYPGYAEYRRRTRKLIPFVY